ncbi:hypothetical protein TNCV_4456871 [Trichonephila clavipes]|nr:hypothetical protein TNCV_4456871 [Trichonephila clavipes]
MTAVHSSFITKATEKVRQVLKRTPLTGTSGQWRHELAWAVENNGQTGDGKKQIALLRKRVKKTRINRRPPANDSVGDDTKQNSFFKTQENTWASECTCKLLLSHPSRFSGDSRRQRTRIQRLGVDSLNS